VDDGNRDINWIELDQNWWLATVDLLVMHQGLNWTRIGGWPQWISLLCTKDRSKL
jgi:hypothetical protein